MWSCDERGIIVMSNWRKAYSYASACFNLFFSGGMIFGWAGMNLLLQREGVYVTHCKDPQAMCPARANLFMGVYSAAFTCLCIGYLVAGMLVNKLGAKLGNAVGLAINAAGLCLLALASDRRFDVYRIAYCLLGFGGAFLQSTTVHCASLYPDHNKLALSVLSGSFTMSSSIFALMNYLHESFGLVFQKILIGYACFHLLLLINALYIMPVELFSDLKIIDVGVNLYSKKNTMSSNATPASPKSKSPQAQNEGVAPMELAAKLAALASKTRGTSFKEMVLSVRFLVVCLNSWFNFLVLNFWISTYQELLYDLGDNARYWSRLSSFIIPFGPIFSPIFGALMDQWGIRMSGIGLNVAQLVLCLVPQIRSIPTLMLGVLLYSANRPMLSSFVYAEIESKFGLRNFSLMFGLVAILTGLTTSSSIIMLSSAAQQHSLQVVFGGLAVVCAISTAVYHFDIGRPSRSRKAE